MRQSFAPMQSGYVGVTYEIAGRFNPPMPPTANEDPGNGLLGAIAILMALLHRDRTGVGQAVENAQLNASMTHMAHVVRTVDGDVVGADQLDPLQLGNGAFERLYETADGWVCVVAYTDADREALVKTLGVDRVPGDDHQADLVAGAFAARATATAIEEIRNAGVTIAEPAGRSMHRLMNDPEQRRVGRVAEVAHPDKGNVRELHVLLRVSDAEQAAHRLAPGLGEHTDEVLGELGCDAAAIASLRANGAVR